MEHEKTIDLFETSTDFACLSQKGDIFTLSYLNKKTGEGFSNSSLNGDSIKELYYILRKVNLIED